MTESAGGNSKAQKRPAVWSKFLFLAVVVVLYAILFLVEPGKAGAAVSFGLKVLAKLWPVLIFVFFLMFVVELLVKPSWIRRHVGQGSGVKGFWVALVGGVVSMGPVYIWYTMLRDFQEKGMRPALVAVFFYGRGVKIPLLPLMAFYFGATYTVILTVYMLAFAVLTGFCTEWLVARKT